MECVGKGVCMCVSAWSCNVGGGFALRLLLSSLAETQEVFFLPHNSNHQESDIGTSLTASDRHCSTSIDETYCKVCDKVQEEPVDGANTKKQATVSLFVWGLRHVQAPQMSHCVELLVSFLNLVLTLRLDPYSTLVYAHGFLR